MREIAFDDAKAKLGAIVDDVMSGEEVAIMRHGRKEAVVLSWAAWERLSAVPSFGRLLASAPLEGEGIERDQTAFRTIDF